MNTKNPFLVFYFVAVMLSGVEASAQGIWTQKTNIFSNSRAGMVGFSIGNKGYLGTGWQFGTPYFKDFWEWDKTTNTWTQKANFPGTARGDAVGFAIGNKGYIGTGRDSTRGTNDFYEWDQATNLWTQKTSLPGSARSNAIGFSIGSKGYVGIGIDSLGTLQDFWEWDQSTNIWIQKANFGGGMRESAVCFVIGNKGYVGTGTPVYNDFWEYDPNANSWTQKANLPGASRSHSGAFSIGTKGYIGTGWILPGNNTCDFYEWDQATNTWSQKANYPNIVSDIDRSSFTIGCHGYFSCGYYESGSTTYFFQDLWEYTPDNLPSINANITDGSTICVGDSVLLSASGGIAYLWNTGNSTNSINVSPTATTTYSVTVSSDCGSKIMSTTIGVISFSAATFINEFDPCKSKCVSFNDQSVGAFTWNWDFGDGNISTLQNPCHNYSDTSAYTISLIINKSTTCADTFNMVVPYVTHDTSTSVYVPNAFSPNEDGSNDVLAFFRKDMFCLKEFELTIYNRWGEQIFQTADINSTWDGTFNGEKLNSQVFSYYCKTTTSSGKQETKKGNISLIR